MKRKYANLKDTSEKDIIEAIDYWMLIMAKDGDLWALNALIGGEIIEEMLKLEKLVDKNALQS